MNVIIGQPAAGRVDGIIDVRGNSHNLTKPCLFHTDKDDEDDDDIGAAVVTKGVVSSISFSKLLLLLVVMLLPEVVDWLTVPLLPTFVEEEDALKGLHARE